MEQKITKRRGSRFERAKMARLAAVQAIFQLGFDHAKPDTVIHEFLSQRFKSPDYPYLPDKDLFLKILQEGQAQKEIIQNHLHQCLREGWSSDRLDPVLAAILTAAITELISQNSSVAAPVIISEYVDLTKSFFQGQEPGYVNKVLDQLARTLKLPLTKADAELQSR